VILTDLTASLGIIKNEKRIGSTGIQVGLDGVDSDEEYRKIGEQKEPRVNRPLNHK